MNDTGKKRSAQRSLASCLPIAHTPLDMPQTPNLLNDDGSASMATMLMMSHHAFRRDIARFMRAIAQAKAGDHSRDVALKDEWDKSYHLALHGHHTIEDTKMFPDLKAKHPDLAAAIDTLTDQHHHIDPLLDRGDAAFADLAHPENAEAVLNELKALLDEHLVFEEAQVTPWLRDAKEFPVPPDDAAATMYADGFAWSMQGIAPEVLEQVRKMLPEILLAKLPDAQKAFEERSAKTWGSYEVGSAVTPIPERF